METAHLIRSSLWLLAAAATLGTAMAVICFASNRAVPVLLAKSHSLLTCAALTLLVYQWATTGLPTLASVALALLLMAAVGGLAVGQAWRWKRPHLVEPLLFAHLSVAAAGFFLLLAAPLM